MKYFIVYRHKVQDSRLFNCEIDRADPICDKSDIIEIEKRIQVWDGALDAHIVVVNWRLFE